MLFGVVKLRELCIAKCAAHRRHVIGRPLAALVMERAEMVIYIGDSSVCWQGEGCHGHLTCKPLVRMVGERVEQD